MGRPARPGLSYGNLGRLHLDWGYLDQAEECFLQDLAIARNTHDERGEALMHNGLGRIALERGLRPRVRGGRARPGSTGATPPAGWTRASAPPRAAGRSTRATPRKDRALLHLAEGQLEAAEAELRRAEELFRPAGFAEGLAHTDRAWGIIRRGQGRFDEAKQKLRTALDHFSRSREQAERRVRSGRSRGSRGPPASRGR